MSFLPLVSSPNSSSAVRSSSTVDFLVGFGLGVAPRPVTSPFTSAPPGVDTTGISSVPFDVASPLVEPLDAETDRVFSLPSLPDWPDMMDRIDLPDLAELKDRRAEVVDGPGPASACAGTRCCCMTLGDAAAVPAREPVDVVVAEGRGEGAGATTVMAPAERPLEE